jgi:hypothetical protein
MSSAWFQLPGHNVASPSLRGVRRAVPPLPRYYGVLRLLAAHLAALCFLRLAIPSFRPRFVPTGSGREPWISLELVSRAPAGRDDGDGKASQVPGKPV